MQKKTQEGLMRWFLILNILILAGCSQGISLMPYHDADASPHGFIVCHGFGCSFRTFSSLSEKEWKNAIKPLVKKSRNAEQERQRIAQVISRIEHAVQQSSGLNVDLGQARTFEKDQHQMDCLDETINTSRYLAFLDEAGLLEYHSAGEPIHRGYFIDGMWPHNSATIQDRETGDIYAVDSYYFDNGERVDIVPKQEWLSNWRPPEFRVPTPIRKPAFS